MIWTNNKAHPPLGWSEPSITYWPPEEGNLSWDWSERQLSLQGAFEILQAHGYSAEWTRVILFRNIYLPREQVAYMFEAADRHRWIGVGTLDHQVYPNPPSSRPLSASTPPNERNGTELCPFSILSSNMNKAELPRLSRPLEESRSLIVWKI